MANQSNTPTTNEVWKQYMTRQRTEAAGPMATNQSFLQRATEAVSNALGNYGQPNSMVQWAADAWYNPRWQPETNYLEGYRPKGQPYTALPDEDLAKIHNSALDAIRPNQDWLFTPFTVDMRQMLEPYYGKNLDAEIAKAKAYADQDTDRGSRGYRPDFSKLTSPVNVEIISDGGAVYDSEENKAKIPNANYKGYQSATDDAQNLRNFPANIALGKWLDQNSYEPEDLDWLSRNPKSDFMQIAEHEIGHASAPKALSSPLMGVTHLGKGAEWGNAMGRIQRETYAIYGKRWEDPKAFDKFLDVQSRLPREKRFKGYSIEGKRALRTFMKAKEEVPWSMWQNAIRTLPKMVQGEQEYPSKV